MRVMVEITASAHFDLQDPEALATQMRKLGFELDPDLEPVPMNETGHGAQRQPTSVILSGTIADAEALDALNQRPDVINIWGDTPIAPFAP